ncbi:MAG: 16S rRNA (guanine(966)-N(2))-methyltransferase RsmD [Symploca sp. SIO3C6]|uniref:16S rRNA (Guanine(966)-N(2))-methyltransferase RsmD n=1 Tax=Symploca sp. SIO1C4 TaxID=2607765 RepID=A0A6B3NB15_9CYAN|nr:16S rRNA (guanine(966)-N(2))-methyltransferase RsmD [Symploca sp. SIO3C6]NER27772.1 16S rRNA (guanine(966)-N(2))-methyltransferase RsmD [Symploca sp. SIO1C4]
MRIYGNRQLKTLPGQTIRPTPARVREAVFNIWRGKISGCQWLDLCAGNGSMGAEALCRGASSVVGIDKWSKACTITRQNWQQLAQTEQKFQVLRGDVVERIKDLDGQKFDLIYFDPPYASELYQPVLEAIANYQLLEQDGELAVEHSSKHWRMQALPHLEICRQKVYGNTALTFYSTV